MEKQMKISLILILCFLFFISSIVNAQTMQIISSEKIVFLAQNQLKKTIPLEDYSLNLVSRLSNQPVPQGKVSLTVQPVNPKAWGGNVAVPVNLLIDGKKYRTVFVTFNVKVYKKAIVAKKEIKKGEILSEENIELKRTNVSNLISPIYSDISKVLGAQAVRYLANGSVINDKDIRPVPLVEKNNIITLRARIGAVEITTAVKALGDGGMGQMVQVQNLDSKKKLYATVVGEGLVEIREN